MTRTVFLTVRTASTRLPSKCLRLVDDNTTAVEFLINRLSKKGYVIILCTSDSPGDDELVALVQKTGKASIFRGSEEDKLKRWIDCADQYNVSYFVTADGDDIFVEPELIDMAFEQYRNHWHGFINSPNTPSGSFSWLIETAALKRVYSANVSVSTNTEMGWAWFDDVHEIDNIPAEFLRKDVRMTMDYEEDWDFFRKTIAAIGDAPLRDILSYLDSNRHIADINMVREVEWKSNQNALVDTMKSTEAQMILQAKPILESQ